MTWHTEGNISFAADVNKANIASWVLPQPEDVDVGAGDWGLEALGHNVLHQAAVGR